MKGFLMPATALTTLKKNIAFTLLCCTVLMMFVAGSTAASAQSCPTSPNYSPDFTGASSPACLTLNNNGDTGYPGFYGVVNAPTPPPTVTTVLRLTPNATGTAGSAWYKTQQPVTGAFSTTFTFELTGSNTGYGPADGIAFVIQNSPAGTGALGPDGCGIGFGDSSTGCAPSTGGIPQSLAVEFDTFQNADDPNNNHVAIQSCLTGPNSIDVIGGPCKIADKPNLSSLPVPVTLADGNVHTVEITYSGSGTKLLDVILDGNDLFPGGVSFDMTKISLNSGNAWVGFTAATGGGDDNQDILSWTFTPGAQTIVVSQGTPAVASFSNASNQPNVYDYTAQLTALYTGNPAVTIQPTLMTPAACNALVQKNFWPARCFVYENAENSGLDAAVLFSVTCSNGPCGSSENPFDALLGTDFEFLASENPFFVYPGIAGFLNPFPGWLKGSGPYVDPCTPPLSGPLFQSNQVSSFIIDGGHTVGSSGGGASCWVATYDTPGENPPGIKITSPAPFATYTKGSVVPATYACNNPSTSQPTSNPTGPYLTAASCKQNSGTPASCTFTSPPGGGLSCTGGTVDTSSKGLHAFVVTAIDSGQNQNLQIVPYTVK